MTISCILLSVLGCTNLSRFEKNDDYTFTGNITPDSYTNFEKALAAQKIKTVIFKDCDGGNMLAGLNIAKSIKTNSLNTIASGRVTSACAFAFLGGITRTVGPTNENNAVKFHGGSDVRTGQPLGIDLNQKVLELLFFNTRFEFNKTIKDIILNTQSEDEGAIFIKIFSTFKKAWAVTLYCPPDSNFKPEKCKKLDGITLESEGIVTK